MAFNIDEFNSRIAKSGIGRTNYFEGIVLGGPGLLSKYGTADIPYRIESLNLPGRNILTFEQRYHGLPRSLPFSASYQPCTMTIILSQDYRERELFMRWQDYALGFYRQGYDSRIYPGMFDTRYYDDAIGKIQIKVYSNPSPTNASNYSRDFTKLNVSTPNGLKNIPNDSGTAKRSAQLRNQHEVQYIISLEEAYPISVNDIAMSWGDEGYARLNVEMRYRYAIESHTLYYEKTELKSVREIRNEDLSDPAEF
jgi:hypothetical protein